MTYQKRAPHILLFFMILCLMSFYGTARSKNTKKETPVYSFTIDHEVKRTPVKNQYRTGTCWCFATISFLESELLRTGKGEVDLSEMFVVRHTYPHKALKYVRYHGNATFGQGGQSHDVFDAIKRYGIVTEQAYSGKNIGEKRHNHSEMKRILTAILDSVLKKRWGTQITPRWMEAFKAVLDVYLGKLPEKFTIKGKEYTPKDFLSEYTGLNFDNYVELTSYTHHPFYKTCCLEIPDNWTHNSNYYNIPIDELERIVDHALKNGYSVIWDGDVSERDFSYRKSKTSRSTGYAIVPLKDWEEKMTHFDIDKYAYLDSPFHNFDPRAKVLCFLFLIFSIVLLNDIRVLLIAFFSTIILVVISKIPLGFILKRLKWVAFFIFAVLIVLPFTIPGEAVLSIGFLIVLRPPKS